MRYVKFCVVLLCTICLLAGLALSGGLEPEPKAQVREKSFANSIKDGFLNIMDKIQRHRERSENMVQERASDERLEETKDTRHAHGGHMHAN